LFAIEGLPHFVFSIRLVCLYFKKVVHVRHSEMIRGIQVSAVAISGRPPDPANTSAVLYHSFKLCAPKPPAARHVEPWCRDACSNARRKLLHDLNVIFEGLEGIVRAPSDGEDFVGGQAGL
jgi:hypothetical protein